MMSGAKGRKMPRGDKQQIMNFEFDLPPLDEQKRIAGILGSLDDKIELNNKINANLEEQAQALFNYYITKNIAIEEPISNIVDVRDGTHDSPKIAVKGFPLITSKHLDSYSVRIDEANIISEADYTKTNERSKVNTFDILYSMIGTVGSISLVTDDDVKFAIKNVGLFRTSQSPSHIFYIFCFLNSSQAKAHLEMSLVGSTQKYISLGELRKFPIPLIASDKIDMFNQVVKPMFKQIIVNIRENKNLSDLRNTLLPKLMNNKIKL